MELVADAPGSKRSRSERMPRTTMASSAASSHAAASAYASDAVERLSEQQSCRAQEAVKEDSAESRTMEAMVLAAPAACGGCAARGLLGSWSGRVFFLWEL